MRDCCIALRREYLDADRGVFYFVGFGNCAFCIENLKPFGIGISGEQGKGLGEVVWRRWGVVVQECSCVAHTEKARPAVIKGHSLRRETIRGGRVPPGFIIPAFSFRIEYNCSITE